MPEKIPLDLFHSVNHYESWFEDWQHNNYFYGHLDMPDQPTEDIMKEDNEYDQYQQHNNGWSDFGWSDDYLG